MAADMRSLAPLLASQYALPAGPSEAGASLCQLLSAAAAAVVAAAAAVAAAKSAPGPPMGHSSDRHHCELRHLGPRPC